MSSLGRRLGVLVPLALFATAGLAAPASAAPGPHTINVGPSDSIQAAIDAARPGDTIIVHGTHAESLTIPKDRIHLEGAPGAAIVAPSGGADMGILVADVTFNGDPEENPPTINHIVKGVHLSGLSISGFGDGVFTFGASDTLIENSTAFGNEGYGFFTNTSSGTTFRHDTASDGGEAGFYIGDSPKAKATVDDVEAFDNGFGIFVRDAEGVSVRAADLHDNCIGLLVLADAPGPAGHVTVRDSQIHDNTRECPGSADDPTNISGVGVGIAGGDHVALEHDSITGNVAGGPTDIPPSGVVVVTGDGGTPPNYNSIKHVTFADNAQDVFWDGTGSHNKLS